MSASSGMCDLEVCHEPVNDVGGRFKGRFSQLGIDHGGLGIGMTQDLLDNAQIYSLFQEMGSIGMAQGMDGGFFVYTGLGQGLLEGDLNTGYGHGLISDCLSMPAATGRREEPVLIAVSLPELSEEFQSAVGQGDVAVLVALASDMEEHAVAVDVGDLQGSAFGQSQPAGVDGGETNPMAEHVDAGEGLSDFIEAQDGGQGLDPLGFEQTDGGPVPFEGVLIEELDSTESNGTGHPRPAGDIGAVEEILPQFLIGDQIGGLVIVFSQLADGSGVGFLCARREAAKLHVLDHSFAQSAHSRPPVS